MGACLQLSTHHSSLITSSKHPVAASVRREQLGTRLRRRGGGKRRALGTRPPSWVRKLLEASATFSRSRPPLDICAPLRSNWRGFTGPVRWACGARVPRHLQAAARLFNNPRAARRPSPSRPLLAGKQRVSATAGLRARAPRRMKVSMTGQFEGGRQNGRSNVERGVDNCPRAGATFVSFACK